MSSSFIALFTLNCDYCGFYSMMVLLFVGILIQVNYHSNTDEITDQKGRNLNGGCMYYIRTLMFNKVLNLKGL